MNRFVQTTWFDARQRPIVVAHLPQRAVAVPGRQAALALQLVGAIMPTIILSSSPLPSIVVCPFE